jgi:methionyl-tRNA formyltransferase
VLFGDGEWASSSLRRLADGPHRVVGVVVRADPSEDSLEREARRAGIPVLQPPGVNDQEVLQAVAGWSPDLCLSIAYNQILRARMLAVAPLGAVNFHAGMLPFYRGRNVITWAILNGEEAIGLTAHFMDTGVDTGDIILQRSLPIGWTDDYGVILGRVVREMPSLVSEAVDAIACGRYQRRPQAHLPGTYFGGRGPGDEWLDWSESSRRLHNKVRAIARPGPGARTLLGEETVLVWKAYYDPRWPTYIATPGQVVGRSRGDGVLVKTGDSTLLLQEVERAGRSPGEPDWPIGTRLGLDVRAELERLRTRS